MITQTYKSCLWCFGTFEIDEEHNFDVCKAKHKPILDVERLFLFEKIASEEFKEQVSRLQKEIDNDFAS